MAVSRAKKFEDLIKLSFEAVPHTTVTRLPDPVMGYLGYRNICDYIVYHYPNQYFIECKTVQGNTLSIHSIPKPDKHGILHGYYGNITDNQWEGMLDVSYTNGVQAGVLCWWVDKDVTKFIPIQTLQALYKKGQKSVRYDLEEWHTKGHIYKIYPVEGVKKRVFFDYNMEQFFRRTRIF